MKNVKKCSAIFLSLIMFAANIFYCTGYGQIYSVKNEAELITQLSNAENGDIIQITGDIYLSVVINLTKDITIESSAGNNFSIFKETSGRHFNISTYGYKCTLTLKDVTLDGTDAGGGVALSGGGNLIMDGGSVIQNCYVNGSGAAINVNASLGTYGASVIMKSGSVIRDCNARFYAGGIYIGAKSTVTMEAGSAVLDCFAPDYGGGIYINNGEFIMNGGEISGCGANGGGGIYLNYPVTGSSTANVVINGGVIKDCTARYGGGILFQNTACVKAMEAIITGNYSSSYGGGIAVLDGNLSAINISKVSGNSALLADEDNEQISVLSDFYPPNGKVYSYEDYYSSSAKPALLNGDAYSLSFFKIYDEETDGHFIGFCCELEQANVSASNYYNCYFLSNARLTKEQEDKIKITVGTALYGNMYYDDVANDALLRERAFTAQYMIWNISLGYCSEAELSRAKDIIQEAMGNSAAKCVEEIINQIKIYDDRTVSEFNAVLEYDSGEEKYIAVITDINEILSNYSISSLPQEVSAVINADNTLTVTCKDKSALQNGGVIELSYTFGLGNGTIYFHPLYQDLVITEGTREIELYAYINLTLKEAPETPPTETEPPETVPAETSPPETSPVETAPPETSPAETAPPETSVVETAPLETAPPEIAPTETAPAETATSETTPPEFIPTETSSQVIIPSETSPQVIIPIIITPPETSEVIIVPTETTPNEAIPIKTTPPETTLPEIVTSESSAASTLDIPLPNTPPEITAVTNASSELNPDTGIDASSLHIILIALIICLIICLIIIKKTFK